jgi:predicted Zn-dependent protease with MMP-like domain
MKISERNFEKLVIEAVEELPKEIREKMENVAITVEGKPTFEELKRTGTKIQNLLLGLYQGIPKTSWGRGFGGNLPDKITIFQGPIETLAKGQREIKELVKIVVWHEIAHHFGIGEKQVRELEKKWKKSKG